MTGSVSFRGFVYLTGFADPNEGPWSYGNPDLLDYALGQVRAIVEFLLENGICRWLGSLFPGV